LVKLNSELPIARVSVPTHHIFDTVQSDKASFANDYGGGGFHLCPVNKGKSGNLNWGIGLSSEEEFSPNGYVLSCGYRLNNRRILRLTGKACFIGWPYRQSPPTLSCDSCSNRRASVGPEILI